MEKYANNASSTLVGGINNSVTSLSVAVATSFPSAGSFRILIDSEIMLVTSVSGTTFTLATRGTIDGTSAASHLAGATITHVVTKESLLKLISDRTTYNTLSNLPTASRNGNLYLTSDAQQAIYFDNGSSWNLLPMIRAAKYPTFTVSGVSDEFDDNNFSGWTQVDDGTHQPTITEKNDVVSLLLPGSDTSAHLHAFMKSTTVSTNDYIEMVFRGWGRNQGFNICGLAFTDGTTYNSGSQVIFYLSQSEQKEFWGKSTGFNSFSGATGNAQISTINLDMLSNYFLRIKYNGSNSWTTYNSPDGISWNTLSTFSITLTPTACGFFVTTWGGSLPFVWTIEYFKKAS
jgi:hypothetical protein